MQAHEISNYHANLPLSSSTSAVKPVTATGAVPSVSPNSSSSSSPHSIISPTQTNTAFNTQIQGNAHRNINNNDHTTISYYQSSVRPSDLIASSPAPSTSSVASSIPPAAAVAPFANPRLGAILSTHNLPTSPIPNDDADMSYPHLSDLPSAPPQVLVESSMSHPVNSLNGVVSTDHFTRKEAAVTANHTMQNKNNNSIYNTKPQSLLTAVQYSSPDPPIDSVQLSFDSEKAFIGVMQQPALPAKPANNMQTQQTVQWSKDLAAHIHTLPTSPLPSSYGYDGGLDSMNYQSGLPQPVQSISASPQYYHATTAGVVEHKKQQNPPINQFALTAQFDSLSYSRQGLSGVSNVAAIASAASGKSHSSPALYRRVDDATTPNSNAIAPMYAASHVLSSKLNPVVNPNSCPPALRSLHVNSSNASDSMPSSPRHSQSNYQPTRHEHRRANVAPHQQKFQKPLSLRGGARELTMQHSQQLYAKDGAVVPPPAALHPSNITNFDAEPPQQVRSQSDAAMSNSLSNPAPHQRWSSHTPLNHATIDFGVSPAPADGSSSSSALQDIKIQSSPSSNFTTTTTNTTTASSDAIGSVPTSASPANDDYSPTFDMELNLGKLGPDPASQQVAKRAGSCHHCKTHKGLHDLFFCTSSTLLGTAAGAGLAPGAKACKKKYCSNCLKRLYNPAFQHLFGENNSQWICPACKNTCLCATCTRKSTGEEAPKRSTKKKHSRSNLSATKRSKTAAQRSLSPQVTEGSEQLDTDLSLSQNIESMVDDGSANYQEQDSNALRAQPQRQQQQLQVQRQSGHTDAQRHRQEDMHQLQQQQQQYQQQYMQPQRAQFAQQPVKNSSTRPSGASKDLSVPDVDKASGISPTPYEMRVFWNQNHPSQMVNPNQQIPHPNNPYFNSSMSNNQMNNHGQHQHRVTHEVQQSTQMLHVDAARNDAQQQQHMTGPRDYQFQPMYSQMQQQQQQQQTRTTKLIDQVRLMASNHESVNGGSAGEMDQQRMMNEMYKMFERENELQQQQRQQYHMQPPPQQQQQHAPQHHMDMHYQSSNAGSAHPGHFPSSGGGRRGPDAYDYQLAPQQPVNSLPNEYSQYSYQEQYRDAQRHPPRPPSSAEAHSSHSMDYPLDTHSDSMSKWVHSTSQ